MIRIYELLYPFSQVDETVKKKHIEEICKSFFGVLRTYQSTWFWVCRERHLCFLRYALLNAEKQALTSAFVSYILCRNKHIFLVVFSFFQFSILGIYALYLEMLTKLLFSFLWMLFWKGRDFQSIGNEVFLSFRDSGHR